MKRTILILIFSIGIVSCFAHPAVIDKVEEKVTLTLSQRRTLEKFREVAADLLDDDYERSDEHLLGYLETKKWKIPLARQMLKIAKSWKNTNKIAELSKSNFSSEMLEHFPVRLDGYDKNGCPVMEMHFGDWDMTSYILNQEFSREGFTNIMTHYWQMWAKSDVRNRNSFPKCYQTRLIVSMQNYKASHTSDVNSINACVRMMTDTANYFISSLSMADLVDIPDSFEPILEIVKTTLSDEIQSKIKIHKGKNEDWQKYLDDIVHMDQRSKRIGGTA